MEGGTLRMQLLRVRNLHVRITPPLLKGRGAPLPLPALGSVPRPETNSGEAHPRLIHSFARALEGARPSGTRWLITPCAPLDAWLAAGRGSLTRRTPARWASRNSFADLTYRTSGWISGTPTSTLTLLSTE